MAKVILRNEIVKITETRRNRWLIKMNIYGYEGSVTVNLKSMTLIGDTLSQMLYFVIFAAPITGVYSEKAEMPDGWEEAQNEVVSRIIASLEAVYHTERLVKQFNTDFVDGTDMRNRKAMILSCGKEVQWARNEAEKKIGRKNNETDC